MSDLLAAIALIGSGWAFGVALDRLSRPARTTDCWRCGETVRPICPYCLVTVDHPADYCDSD